MLDLTKTLATLTVAVTGLAGPALAAAHSASHHGHKSKHAHHHGSGHHKSPSVTKSCPDWEDSSVLTFYTKVRATNLACATVDSVETKLAPKLAQGSGPSGPVNESVAKTTFTCDIKLDLVPNKLTGSGKCTASKGRSFTFVATVEGQ